MPYEEVPTTIDDSIAIACDQPGWVRCKCGYRLFFVEEAQNTVLIAYCIKCRKTFRLFLGFSLEVA